MSIPLFDAANVTTDKFLIGELPVNSGDISIMTLKQLYAALKRSPGSPGSRYDPECGYSISIYYVYAINDIPGDNDAVSKSTPANLKTIGVNWYRQLNKPTTEDDRWIVGDHKVFGGPLNCVYCFDNDTCGFDWYYCENFCGIRSSYYVDYWGDSVPDSVYVTVVHS